MAGAHHPQSVKDEAHRLLQSGMKSCEIARKLALPERTIQTWKKSFKTEKPQVSQSELDAMQIAALQAKVQQQSPRVQMEGYDDDPFPAKDVWDRVEIENAKRIERSLSQSKFKATLPSDRPAAICFVSDQHISCGNVVDMKRMRDDALFIATTPNVYVVLGGDGVDNHIKHKSAIIAARSQPDDQWRLYNYYLEILAEKIAVVISGNHDAWTNQIASVDMVKWLAERNRIRYSPHSAYVEFALGQLVYRVCIAHQYQFNSRMNLTHTVKQMLNFGEHDFDIGCVCHHHEPAMESFRRRGLWRLAFRPGAYQITSDYSAQYGFPVAQPTCPTAVVFPNQRKMVGFDDVRDAVSFMRGAAA